MDIFVHSKTLPVTQAIRDFIYRQVAKMGKLSQPVKEIRIYLEDIRTSQGTSQESQVKIKVAIPGKDIVTKAHEKNLYTAISAAVADAVRAVRKRKEYRLTKKTEIRLRKKDRLAEAG